MLASFPGVSILGSLLFFPSQKLPSLPHMHAAYAALTHGILAYGIFFRQTTPNISHLLAALEDSIKTKLIPSLKGRALPNELEQKLFSLPVRLGGLNIVSLTSLHQEYHACLL